MSNGESRLQVLKDGAQLPEEEARELWKEFSAHMDVNRGDMSGFAVKKGWHSVLPEHRAGKAVLVVSTTAEAAKVAAAAAPAVAAKPAGKPAEKPAQKAGPKGGGGLKRRGASSAPNGRGTSGTPKAKGTSGRR
jgi:hypothetical protein